MTGLVGIAGTVVRANGVRAISMSLLLSTAVRIKTLVDVRAIESISSKTWITLTGVTIVCVYGARSIVGTMCGLRVVSSIGTNGRNCTIIVQPWIMSSMNVAIGILTTTFLNGNTGQRTGY